jgi:hypothetical protein
MGLILGLGLEVRIGVRLELEFNMRREFIV